VSSDPVQATGRWWTSREGQKAGASSRPGFWLLLPRPLPEAILVASENELSPGAPRPMKMGTIRSLSPYDAAARDALQSANLRRLAILRYAIAKSVMAWDSVVRPW
jgi:hypothetical protein